MGTKYEKKKFLKQEASLRKNLVSILGYFFWIELVLDIAFYVFYCITGFEYYNAVTYPIVRILPPSLINIISYFAVRHLNNSNKYTDSYKNNACCIGLEIEGAAVGIFHSYFTPLWVIPAFMVFFSFVFNEKKLQWRMFVIGCITTTMAAIYAAYEHGEVMYYAQTYVISLMIYVVVFMISRSLTDYNEKTNIMTEELRSREEKFRHELKYDALTHVYSRQKVFEDADEKLLRCSDGYPVSVAIADIDDFKKVNDTYGHENGDKVLECLGNILKSYQSSMLSIGRYGGEEFVFIFESGTPTEHHEILDNIRIKFWNAKYDFMAEHVSLSAGITSAREPVSFDELLEVADHALYRSKHRGKNCISRE